MWVGSLFKTFSYFIIFKTMHVEKIDGFENKPYQMIYLCGGVYLLPHVFRKNTSISKEMSGGERILKKSAIECPSLHFGFFYSSANGRKSFCFVSSFARYASNNTASTRIFIISYSE